MILKPLPEQFIATREAMHQIAFFAVAPVRHQVEGRMGLRAAPGGFGTPEFNGQIARVEGTLLVHEQHGNVATQEISTVRDACEFFGHDYEVSWFEGFHDPLQPVDPDLPLQVGDEAARALGNWFNFGFAVLTRLRGHGSAGDDVSEAQLWPEHFDAAIEMGDEESGKRASYGASPGDVDHPAPYLYVAAWETVDRSDSFWNDPHFNGASLGYDALLESGDPAGTALGFLTAGLRILRGR